ncbi:hypothetical protein [Streptomyces sp. NBC_01264]|uniref:hypothetical protein n=1 Tax=Streptomyces sp. NBC_01264 TaxID=2903804 RepID=UPI00225728BE|nr:hypothetical protein [Streptomyces sp. NBC_01264]MCX4779117.1 hypothetical protein [Streptomyces sp. NBC_01264]
MTSAVVAATALLGGLTLTGSVHAAAEGADGSGAPGPSASAPDSAPDAVAASDVAAAPAAVCPPDMYARQDGSLSVHSAQDGTGVPEGLAVHLRDKKTGLRVASVDTFRKVTDPEGVFPDFQLVSEPLKLAALGMYTLELGSDAEPVACGDFDYRLRSVVTRVDAADGVSLDHLGTTVTADVTTLDPRTGASAPLKNAKVRLSGDRTSQEATTDARGRVSAPFTFRGTEDHTDVRVDVLDTPELSPGSGSETARAVRQKAEIVLDPESRKLKARYGSTTSITGRAYRTAADGTRKPVPEGTPMLADLGGEPRTTADGHFERQLRTVHRGQVKTTWAGGRSPWLRYVSAETEVEVVEVSYFTDVKTTIGSAGVTFTGSLAHKPLSPAPTLVEVQYSADGKTDWTTREVFTVDLGSTRFDRTLPGEPDGYWRLRYAAAPRMQGSVTEPVRLTRTATEFTKFNAGPEPLGKGQTFFVKGTLRHGTPAKAYGGQLVLFYFQAAGSQEYVYQGQARTTEGGAFSHTFTAEGTGSWIARYRDADGKHFDAESRRDEVTVKP